MLFFDDLLPEETGAYNEEFIKQLHQICEQNVKPDLLPLLEYNKTCAITNVRQRLLEFAQSSPAEAIYSLLQPVHQERPETDLESLQPKRTSPRHKKRSSRKTLPLALILST